ncbi:hypothetical protein SISNIDRAFT_471290 [Sistotremastrum niveocremeum HHB9708]|uniref:Uncharacterized protein n=1 Tax=Sistotremastrum niveocremeum HHB9708 TaxID=1314777 RepID=A0A164MUW8_9AGAM|nr:hypothetical protein SISNIDRAFT_471290 [Sistotremastrum niveocremeum HHB9708]
MDDDLSPQAQSALNVGNGGLWDRSVQEKTSEPQGSEASRQQSGGAELRAIPPNSLRSPTQPTLETVYTNPQICSCISLTRSDPALAVFPSVSVILLAWISLLVTALSLFLIMEKQHPFSNSALACCPAHYIHVALTCPSDSSITRMPPVYRNMT